MKENFIKASMLTAVSIILLAAAGCTTGPMNPFAKSAGNEINPMTRQTEWRYSVTSSNSSSYYGVSNVLYTYEDSVEADTGYYLDVLRKRAFDENSNLIWDLNVYRYQDEYGYYSYSQNIYDEHPRAFMKYPVFAGKVWSQEFEEPFLYSYDRLKGEVVGQEDTCGYSGCWHVKLTFTVSDDDAYPEYTIDSWYAEGAGLVLEHTVVDQSDVLIELDTITTY